LHPAEACREKASHSGIHLWEAFVILAGVYFELTYRVRGEAFCGEAFYGGKCGKKFNVKPLAARRSSVRSVASKAVL
jgi:hypothetical protein